MTCKKQLVKEVRPDLRKLMLLGGDERVRIMCESYNQRQNVIIHGSALEEVPLDPRCGVKAARMVRSPFIVGDQPFSIARDKE